jgi:lipopolysaccharide/colanic/teichoic acid biosynthesis glycosyltransferase
MRLEEKLEPKPDFEKLTAAGGRLYLLSKRILDVLVASVAIIALLPLWILIAFLIKVTSRGPVFYCERNEIGQYGKTFTLYKFRTMYWQSDNSQHKKVVTELIRHGSHISEVTTLDGRRKKVYKIVCDPRVTPLGRILRKIGLDEAPQFINVLKGEMSIVGPRPALSYEYENYHEWHKKRLLVKPGITGLYQVTARSEVPFDEMVKIDLDYISRRSLWLDIKIMLATIPVMLTGKGGH